MADETPAQKLRSLDERMSRIVRSAIRNDQAPPRGTKDPGWEDRMQDLLETAGPHHLPHSFLREVENRDLKVRRGLSFKAFLLQESEARRLGPPSMSWLLEQKLAAYRFVDELGVRRPAAELRSRRFDKLSLTPPMVVKPRRSTGSKGCYLISAEDDIVHVKDGARFTSLSEMRDHAHELMRGGEGGRALPDHWISEELILEDRTEATPAGDLKYYCFYGEILYVLEVQRHGGEAKYSFRYPDGTPFIPEGSWNYEYFEGKGSTNAEMEQARQISLEIPHPFCRIDLLRGENELVFGEFTPRPGGFHNFSPALDRWMGEAWALAQHRLQMDLLAGKSFEPFVRATRLHKQEDQVATTTASRPGPEPPAPTPPEHRSPGKARKQRSFTSRIAGAVRRRLPFRRG